ncbi:MAG: class I SAM-dependent methyltransferase [Elusimicrobia bacterium]|nr:class I SAM-dependent methyltransferase [Elusimicrobiota bacterium]
MMPHPPGCPACGSPEALRLVEEHRDRIGGREYRLLLCPDCQVVSSEPRDPVGADWYAKLAPARVETARDPLHGPAPEDDWRFSQFFSDRLPGGRLLDVGCGGGDFMALAARKGYQPVGFDYDGRVVQEARRKGLDAYCTDFEAFVVGRQEGEFDILTLFDVLEHTPEPAWFLQQLKRLLRPGGHIALTMPNSQRPIPFEREEHDYPPHHFTRWSPSAMKAFLERQGFEVVRQDASTLHLRYLTDHLFFYRIMPGLLSLARRLLLKDAGGSGRTFSEALSATPQGKDGWLSDQARRQRLVDLARFSFQVLAAPLAALQRARHRSRQPDCGDCLYTLARAK